MTTTPLARRRCSNGHVGAYALRPQGWVVCTACTNERKRAARAAAKLAPAAPPLDPVEDDGRRYPIDEWHRLFGRPRIAWAEQYDHHPAPNPQEGTP